MSRQVAVLLGEVQRLKTGRAPPAGGPNGGGRQLALLAAGSSGIAAMDAQAVITARLLEFKDIQVKASSAGAAPTGTAQHTLPQSEGAGMSFVMAECSSIKHIKITTRSPCKASRCLRWHSAFATRSLSVEPESPSGAESTASLVLASVLLHWTLLPSASMWRCP